MRQPWESTPFENFMGNVLDFIIWLIQAALWLALVSIPILIAVGLILFIAKYLVNG